jgi:hypothetical protein
MILLPLLLSFRSSGEDGAQLPCQVKVERANLVRAQTNLQLSHVALPPFS